MANPLQKMPRSYYAKWRHICQHDQHERNLLRLEIDALAASLGKCFADLPADAKVRVLEFEKTLCVLRRHCE